MATRFNSIFAISLILPIVGCNSATQPNAASTPAQSTTVASPTNELGNSQQSSAVGAKVDQADPNAKAKVPVDVAKEISPSERVLNPKDSNKSPSKAGETATTATTAASTGP
jgi:hypothetical protein